MNITERISSKLVILIYVLMFFLIILKVNFYDDNVGRFPDESAHISYIAYLEKNGGVIPEFEKMTKLTPTSDGNFQFAEGTINYLGHPPLYYQIMRLSGGIEILGDTVFVDINALRNLSQMIAYLAIIIAFYIGFKLLNSIPLHLLYSGIIVSIPMLTYSIAGVSNDTLALLGVSVTALGLVRYKDGKESFFTYLIIALGVFITSMSKLTAGMIIIIAGILFILNEFVQGKSAKIIVNKNMFLTIPLYMLILVYYINIMVTYNAIHPGLANIAPEYFKTSGFYVGSDKRIVMTLLEYMSYYWERFFKTWTGIHSHVALVKPGSIVKVESIGLFSVWLLPVMSFFTIKKVKFKNIFAYLYIGVLFTSIYQFVVAYDRFLFDGYLGGYQSRYYLCALFAMAMLICFWVKDRYEYIRNELTVKGTDLRKVDISFFIICVSFVILLIYSDIIYFLVNFDNYL